MDPKNIRSSRITKQQKSIIAEFMKNNIKFARGQFEGADGNSDLQKKWEELRQVLHASGGVKKTVLQWQKCWRDMRLLTKKRFNEQQKYINKTGGGARGDDAPKPLSESELSMLNIIAYDAVDGDGDTPEAGVANRTVSIVDNITNEEIAGPSQRSIEVHEIIGDEIIVDDQLLRDTPPTGVIRRPRKRMCSASSRYTTASNKADNMHMEMMAQMQKNHEENKALFERLINAIQNQNKN